MKVAHFAIMSPAGSPIKSGMYESTKDQIKYERKEGLNSIFIDAIMPDNTGLVDDWLKAEDYHDGFNADVWVVHSNLPSNYKERLKAHRHEHKVVSIMHGPVENMVLKEWSFLIKDIRIGFHGNAYKRYLELGRLCGVKPA